MERSAQYPQAPASVDAINAIPFPAAEELGRGHQRPNPTELPLPMQQRVEALTPTAAGMVHEFNNALAVILGWAQVGCQQSPEGSPNHETFQQICIQAQRAASVARQMLNNAHGQRPQMEKTNLNNLVSQTSASLQPLMGKQIEVSLALAPELHAIRADSLQIEQVITNLCLNARDAMPRGGRVVLETENIFVSQQLSRSAQSLNPGIFVRIAVTDTGAGMDEETLKHVLDPLHTTKESGKCAGMGLAIIDGIVRRHGGFINVCSELGQGTTFHIYLPAFCGKS